MTTNGFRGASHRDDTAWYLALLLDQQRDEGRVAVGVGENPHRDENGRYRYSSFHEHYPVWPTQADELAGLIAETQDRADVFVCPALSWNPLRDSKRRVVLPGRWLWADIDHSRADDQVEQLSRQGGFLVASGTAGHRHVYVKLTEPQPAQVIETLNRRLVRYLDADPSPSALSGFLRPAGTLNHKTDPATPVTLIDATDGAGWSLDQLGEVLPSRTTHKSRGLQLALDFDTPVGERSERFFRLVFMAYTDGVGFGDTVTALAAHQPSVDKYGDRLAGEIWRCWRKIESRWDATGRRSRALRTAGLTVSSLATSGIGIAPLSQEGDC